MASNNGYLTHCRICGTPIFSLGNRQFCSACYAQNRRNAAHRSNAEAKMRREQIRLNASKLAEMCESRIMENVEPVSHFPAQSYYP